MMDHGQIVDKLYLEYLCAQLVLNMWYNYVIIYYIVQVYNATSI